MLRNIRNSDIIVNRTVYDSFHHILDCAADILSVQNVLALLVDYLTLFVHNLVILKDMLTRIEVSALEISLSIFNCLCENLCLNRLIFFQSKVVHHSLYPVRAEDSHKVIFKRQEEF